MLCYTTPNIMPHNYIPHPHDSPKLMPFNYLAQYPHISMQPYAKTQYTPNPHHPRPHVP